MRHYSGVLLCSVVAGVWWGLGWCVSASRGDVCESGLHLKCGVLFRVFTVLLLLELVAC